MKKLIVFSVIIILLHCTFNINNCKGQWVQSYGLYGGNVPALITESGNVFAGAYNGVWHSTNNGLTWTQTALNNRYVMSLLKNGINLYAGTYENGVYLSTNNGTSWMQKGLSGRMVMSLFKSGSNIYAGTGNNGVFVTGDGGSNWTQTSLNNKTTYALTQIGINLLAGVEGGIYLSSNAGTNWTQKLGGRCYSFLLYEDTVFAGMQTNPQRSTNQGNSWLQLGWNSGELYTFLLNGNNILAGAYASGVWISTNGGFNWTQTALNSLYVMTLVGGTGSTYAGTNNSIFKSSNNFSTYERVPLNNQFVYALIIKDNRIFCGTMGNGILYSDNSGVNWLSSSYAYGTVRAFSMGDTVVYAGTIGGTGILRTSNNGTIWEGIGPGGKNVYSIASSINYVYAGTNDGVYSSTNRGTNWTQTELSGTIWSLALSGNYIFAGTSGGGVYVSGNNGVNWTQTSLNNKVVNTLLINGVNIYAGTNGSGIYISTNNGTNWTQTSLNNKTVKSISFSGNNIFAGTDSGIYISTNNGANWIKKNQGFIYTPTVNTLLVIGNTSNIYLLAGTDGYSAWRRSVENIIGIKNISREIPSVFSLEQNYPNPFNQSSIIKFQCPMNGMVELKIYDLLGKEVAVLLNEKLQPGTYQVQFNAENLTSGIYYYRLKTYSFSETKKLILLK